MWSGSRGPWGGGSQGLVRVKLRDRLTKSWGSGAVKTGQRERREEGSGEQASALSLLPNRGVSGPSL